MSGQFFLLPCVVEISELITNSVDPDQTAGSAMSNLGLHCLPVSLLWDARHKWVNFEQLYFLILPPFLRNREIFVS